MDAWTRRRFIGALLASPAAAALTLPGVQPRPEPATVPFGGPDYGYYAAIGYREDLSDIIYNVKPVEWPMMLK